MAKVETLDRLSAELLPAVDRRSLRLRGELRSQHNVFLGTGHLRVAGSCQGFLDSSIVNHEAAGKQHLPPSVNVVPLLWNRGDLVAGCPDSIRELPGNQTGIEQVCNALGCRGCQRSPYPIGIHPYSKHVRQHVQHDRVA